MLNSRRLSAITHLCRVHVFRCYHKDHFEVERKFRYSLDKVPLLEQNCGDTRFKSVKFIGETSFTDTYYDVHDAYPLTCNDIWLRQRQNNWECKCPVKLTSEMDSYQEITKITEIVTFLSNKLARIYNNSAYDSEKFKDWLKDIGAKPFTTIITKRRKYLVDDKFTIDLDEADFGHFVGEVELIVSDKNDILNAECDILKLCHQHPWFFDLKGHQMGKLLMYISKYNPKQWDSLQKSGLVKQKLGYIPSNMQRSH
jgi:thiamine-triphosphatase